MRKSFPRWRPGLAAVLACSLFCGLCGMAAAATGLPFLTQASGARALALAEAAVALPASQASANPAVLDPAAAGLGLSHSRWIGDVRLEQIHLAAPRGAGAYGLALHLARADGLERRTGPSTEPLGEFGVYDAVLSLSYARGVGERVRWGLSGKLIRQSIFTRDANGAALDAGLTYLLRPDLRLGAAVANIGGMGSLDREATELPLLGRIGLAYEGIEDLLVGAEIQTVRGRDTDWRLGAEFRALPALALRGGYQSSAGRSFSLGLGVLSGAWGIDYAYVPFDQDLGEAHRFSLRFGGSR